MVLGHVVRCGIEKLGWMVSQVYGARVRGVCCIALAGVACTIGVVNSHGSGVVIL